MLASLRTRLDAYALLSVLLGALSGCSLQPPRGPVNIEANLYAEFYTLANGMTLTLIPDNATREIAVQMRYEGGSAEETDGQHGLTHLVEHLTFDAQDGGKKRSELLHDACTGGYNGSTGWDAMEYTCATTAESLPLAIFEEARRLAFPLEGVTSETLTNNRRIVANEADQREGSVTLGRIPEFAAGGLFPKGHPYHFLPIGLKEDLDEATVEQAKRVSANIFQPEKASLIIAGHFKHDAVVDYVNKCFSGIPSRNGGRHVRRLPKPALAPQEPRRIRVVNGARRTTLFLAFPWPGQSSPDFAAAEVLRSFIGHFVHRENKDIWSTHHVANGLHDSLFLIEANPPAGMTLEKLEQNIRSGLDGNVYKPTLANAKVENMAQLLMSLESTFGKARYTQRFLQQYNHVEGAQLLLREYQAVDEDAVLRILSQLTKGYVSIFVEPVDDAAIAGELAQ
jgi:predicted Zn-dependent peptidase